MNTGRTVLGFNQELPGSADLLDSTASPSQRHLTLRNKQQWADCRIIFKMEARLSDPRSMVRPNYSFGNSGGGTTIEVVPNNLNDATQIVGYAWLSSSYSWTPYSNTAWS